MAGIDLVQKPIRYKTLYYGLHVNHARNVGIVHPLMFTLRRIIYALSIVFIPNAPILGVWIMLIGTLIMLAYALTEWQWKAKIINHQHIFNECITYCVCIYLLMFTNFVNGSTRVLLGYLLLAFFVCFIAYNTIIMLLYLFHNIKLCFKRFITIYRRRNLKLEAQIVFQKIKAALLNLRKKEKKENYEQDSKDWFTADEIDHHWDPVITFTRTGGSNCVIIEKVKSLRGVGELGVE